MNVLAFEECSKINIGSLETALRMFEPSGNSTVPHPLHQRTDESTTNWASRVTIHLRWTKAACIEAGCPERCPNDIQLKQLTFHCISDPILEVAVKIMSDEDLELTTFQATIDLMHRAERRLNKQDPQLTTILAMRTRPGVAAMRQLPLPIIPTVAAPLTVCPAPVPVPPPALTPKPASPSPPPEDIPIDELPEFLVLQEKHVAPLEPHDTVVINNHSYYKLPQDFPALSKSLSDRLYADGRCNNCGDSHPLIPTHKWRQCPFAPHPKRKNSVYPSYHKPIAFTPEPSSVIPVAPGTLPPTLASYHAQFSQLYGSGSPSEHTVYQF